MDNPTCSWRSTFSFVDQPILDLLDHEALGTTVIADRLGFPVRTVRHRLMRLRQAGRVVALPGGSYCLADTVAGPVDCADLEAASECAPESGGGNDPDPLGAVSVHRVLSLAGAATKPAPTVTTTTGTVRKGDEPAPDRIGKVAVGLVLAAGGVIGGLAVLAVVAYVYDPSPEPPRVQPSVPPPASLWPGAYPARWTW